MILFNYFEHYASRSISYTMYLIGISIIDCNSVEIFIKRASLKTQARINKKGKKKRKRKSKVVFLQ